MKKKILITGGAGFIGFNFILKCLKKKYKIFNLDTLKYAANKNEIKKLKKIKDYNFYKININNKNQIKKILNKYKILTIVNFAAESHVDRSINNPRYFFKNNCLDFIEFITALRDYYLKLNANSKKNFKFLHISTDEVYGSLKYNEKPFDEFSPIMPNNPYASSKAACELILRSFSKTYGLPFFLTNCSNNYGKYQNKEKLIPTIIRNAILNKKIPIYGKGNNVRDWIYVDDHCDAIFKVLQKGKKFEKYNIGGYSEINNLDLTKKICSILDKKYPRRNLYNSLITFVKDRPGHDFRYAIDAKKIKKLNWRPKISLNNGLNKIIDHYVKKYL